MAAKDYIDPEGYWLDPDGNVRRMGTTEEDGEQAIIAKLTEVCTVPASTGQSESCLRLGNRLKFLDAEPRPDSLN